MNTYNLIKNIEECLSIFSEDNYLLKILQYIIENQNNSITKCFDTLSHDGQKAQNVNVENKNQIQAFSNNLKKRIQPGALFISINETKSRLNKLDTNFNSEKKYTLKRLNDFYNTYENYIKTYSILSTANLIYLSILLQTSLTTFHTTIQSIKDALQIPVEDYENHEVIDIYFPSHMNFSEFVSNINLIKKLYSELCLLFNLSETSNPLNISKIESGTLWVRLFGESKVVKLLTDLISSMASYIYRNFTREGKITSIPLKVRSIESILHLASSLEKNGVNCEQIKDDLEKSTVIISKELQTLLAGQPKIYLNNNLLSVGDSFEFKYIEESKTLKLKETT